MKTIFSVLIICSLASCSLFKKTSKTTNKAEQSSSKQIESSQLILKRANKETQVFTYLNDSGFYQFQHIKEQVAQAKSGKLKAQEKQETKKQAVVKKTEPVKLWIYAWITILVIGIILVYKRFFN